MMSSASTNGTPSRSEKAPAPAPAFHELIHAPVRLRVCGLLRSVDEVEFAVFADTLR